MENNTKVFKTLLAGLAAGVVIGLLVAPDKGTRDRLTASLKKLIGSIKDTAAAEINNLVDVKNKIVNSVKSIKEEAEKTSEIVEQQYSDSV
jgi:gas vesicle protein